MYANYIIHDSESIIQQELDDEKFQLKCDFKVLKESDNFQSLISFSKTGLENTSITLYFALTSLEKQPSLQGYENYIIYDEIKQQISVKNNLLNDSLVSQFNLDFNNKCKQYNVYQMAFARNESYNFPEVIQFYKQNISEQQKQKEIELEESDLQEDFDLPTNSIQKNQDPQNIDQQIDKKDFDKKQYDDLNNFSQINNEQIIESQEFLKGEDSNEDKQIEDEQNLDLPKSTKKDKIEEKKINKELPDLKKYQNIIAIEFNQIEENCQFYVQKVLNEDQILPKESFIQFFEVKKEQVESGVLRKLQGELQEKLTKQELILLKHSVYNLVGGIVYTYGVIPVINSQLNRIPKSILTGSPSRKLFPRGFLWDDGFHLQVICKVNKQKCQRIQNSWLETMDIFGYISREQARGEEVTRMIPQQFQIQDFFEANPPTLLLSLVQISKEIRQIQMSEQEEKNEIEKQNQEQKESQSKKNNDQDIIEKNESIGKIEKLDKNFFKDGKKFEFLLRWFKWFKQTQVNMEVENKNNVFRWRCKNNNNCEQGNILGSGLDDYPRTQKNQIIWLNLDLNCWVYFFSDSLVQIAENTGQSQRMVRQLKKERQKQKDSIIETFLDPKSQIFKDISAEKGNPNLNQEFSEHIGYINLFPLLFGVIENNSTQLENILLILEDDKQIWSEFGILSLSKQDPLFGTSDDYWRGAIWMPINYLILRAIHKYYLTNQHAKQIYFSLRKNLINNVLKNYQEQGYLYETYHPLTGKGQRGYPFNGWTSLISLIISQNYD